MNDQELMHSEAAELPASAQLVMTDGQQAIHYCCVLSQQFSALQTSFRIFSCSCSKKMTMLPQSATPKPPSSNPLSRAHTWLPSSATEPLPKTPRTLQPVVELESTESRTAAALSCSKGHPKSSEVAEHSQAHNCIAAAVPQSQAPAPSSCGTSGRVDANGATDAPVSQEAMQSPARASPSIPVSTPGPPPPATGAVTSATSNLAYTAEDSARPAHHAQQKHPPSSLLGATARLSGPGISSSDTTQPVEISSLKQHHESTETSSQEQGKRSDLLRERGIDAWRKGRCARALELWSQAQRVSPTDARVHLNIAQAQLQMGAHMEALVAADSALLLLEHADSGAGGGAGGQTNNQQMRAKAMYRRGIAMRELQQLPEAFEALRTAHDLMPSPEIQAAVTALEHKLPASHRRSNPKATSSKSTKPTANACSSIASSGTTGTAATQKNTTTVKNGQALSPAPGDVLSAVGAPTERADPWPHMSLDSTTIETPGAADDVSQGSGASPVAEDGMQRVQLTSDRASADTETSSYVEVEHPNTDPGESDSSCARISDLGNDMTLSEVTPVTASAAAATVAEPGMSMATAAAPAGALAGSESSTTGSGLKEKYQHLGAKPVKAEIVSTADRQVCSVLRHYCLDLTFFYAQYFVHTASKDL